MMEELKMVLYNKLDGYDDKGGGNVEILAQSFDVHGRSSEVLNPFRASVSKSKEFSHYRAEYSLNGVRGNIIYATGYNTPEEALQGLLRQMALKCESDTHIKEKLEGIITKSSTTPHSKK